MIEIAEKLHYLNARVRAMKGDLLDRKDYQKMLKMEPKEISEFLGNLTYSEEIDRLGIEYEGKKLVELAILKDQIKTSEKLVRISKGSYRKVIKRYLLKYDIRNIRKILMWRQSNRETRMPKEELKEYLKESPNLSDRDFDHLMEEDMDLDDIKEFLYMKMPDIKGGLEEAGNLLELEVMLDKSYYRSLKRILKDTDNMTHQVKSFLSYKIDVANIKTVTRLKEAEKKEKIREFLIIPENSSKIGKLDRKTLETMVEQEWDEFLQSLRDTYLSCFLDKKIENREHLENCLDRNLLKKSRNMSLDKPFTISTVIGYLVQKEIEVRNLRSIVRSKELGIKEEEIKKRLIM